jgi:bisphosphoglycerate-independent phosphoglycerate mutase (AlkP superfamily)
MMPRKITIKRGFIHAFTDGRMLIQNREKKYILDLENYIANTSVKLASIVGVIMQWIAISAGNE